jgi:MFS family permease
MLSTSRTDGARADAGDASRPSLSYASYALLVLMICYSLSFVDRQILTLLVGPIEKELGIDDVSMSYLQGLAFALLYTTLGVPIGYLADTRSRRWLISIGIFFWSLMTTLTAGARSFTTLFLARTGVGIGEATLAPGAFSLITDYFPREYLGRALSIYSMGIFIGAGLSMLVGGWVVQATLGLPPIDLPIFGLIGSWRLTFFIVGIPGVLVAIWVASLREPARRGLLRDSRGQATPATVRQVVQQIGLRWQSILGISMGMVFQATCTYGLLAWTPTTLQRVHGWSPAQAGSTLGPIIIVFGCLGMYLGGWLTDRWRTKGLRDAPLVVGAIGAVIAGLFLSPALNAKSATTLVTLLAPGLVGLGMPMGVSYAALQWILPNQVRGQISAVFLFLLNLGGITMGPFFPAKLSRDVFGDPKMIGVGLAIAIAVASVLQLTAFLSTRSHYRRDTAAMETVAHT